IKRIRRDQVEGGPLPYFARKDRAQVEIIILILAGVVNGRANIEAGEPGASRAVPERAGKGSSVRQRASQGREKHIRTREPKSVTVGTYLKLEPGQIGPV